MKGFITGLRRFMREEEGVTMVEYGLIAALIAIVCIIAITGVGNNLNLVFTEICNKLAGAIVGGGAACA
jgi:pilus assembly protein Flp/PilA